MNATSPRVSRGSTPAPALILLHDRKAGLWDVDLRRFATEVGERLDGVYVACATGAGTGPGLADAIAAARYVGCSRAVLVNVGGNRTGGEVIPSRGLHLTRVAASFDTDAVVRAYRTAVPARHRVPLVGAA